MDWLLAARRALPGHCNCFEANMSGIWPCSARDGRTKSIVAAFAVCAEIVRSSARLAGTRTVIHAPAIHVGRQRPHVLDRSEERRVGKEGVRTIRSRGSTDP